MKLTKSLIFCFLSVLLSVCAQAQDVSNKGKVAGKNGIHIRGVSILFNGTSNATSSDRIRSLTIFDSYCGNNSFRALLV